jgi:hypothetical protein
VTDSDAIETAVKIFGFAMPCPVKTFDIDEAEAGRRWLQESLGSIHIEEIGPAVLLVRLAGKLDTSAYSAKRAQLRDYVAAHQRFRLLLDLRDFDGWQGLGALGDHLSLVREHHRAPSRVAVVGDKAWMKLAQTAVSSFIDAKTSYFDKDDFDGARAWLLS